MVVQVPQHRRHSFKDEEELDLFAHIPKIMKHIKKYQSYRQQVSWIFEFVITTKHTTLKCYFQLVLLRYNGVAKALKMFGEDTDPVIQSLSKADVLIRKIQVRGV